MRQHRSRRSAGPFFSVLPEKNGEKRGAEDAPYCALTRAIFWPLRGLNALFGRRVIIFPIAYGSDKCTTRICGQTAIISVPLISGILGLLRFCTACCRGRCGHRPLQTFTKNEQGGQGRPPLQGAVRGYRWSGIPKMSRTKTRCSLSATACSTFVGSKAIGRVSALRPTGREKESARKRHKSFSSASFCLLFLAQQKK